MTLYLINSNIDFFNDLGSVFNFIKETYPKPLKQTLILAKPGVFRL